MAIVKIVCPHCGKEISTNDGRCAARTKAGGQCSRAATNGNYCWQHSR